MATKTEDINIATVTEEQYKPDEEGQDWALVSTVRVEGVGREYRVHK